MSTTIPHPETGEPVEIFARISNGYVDALCRAAYKSAWDAAALANGLTDEDGNPVPGVSIDIIGPVMTVPGVYDEDGKEVSAPQFDDRYHVNLRVAEDRAWLPIMLAWMQNGNDDAVPNKDEETRTLARVSLIDPDSIKTPTRVWL